MAMAEQDIHVDINDIVLSGTLQRIHVSGDPAGKKNGWYVAHFDDRPAGKFGCNLRYGSDRHFLWSMDVPSVPLSAEEKRARLARMEAARECRAAEAKARHEAAAGLASRIWASATPVDGDAHPYLERKGIHSHGLKVGAWEKFNKDGGLSVIEKNALLVPIRDASESIRSLQAIMPDANNALKRDKDYLTDGDKQGYFYSIGNPRGSVAVRRSAMMCGTT
jgi:putative DNA primase/helicase